MLAWGLSVVSAEPLPPRLAPQRAERLQLSARRERRIAGCCCRRLPLSPELSRDSSLTVPIWLEDYARKRSALCRLTVPGGTPPGSDAAHRPANSQSH